MQNTSLNSDKVIARLASFFNGRIYPAIVALLVVIGHLWALEFYFNIVNMLLISTALLVSRSLKPVIPVFLTFLFQISLENSPSGKGDAPDYYFTEGRGAVTIALFVIVAVCFVYSVVKNKYITLDELKRAPMKYSSLALTVAFLTGGMFSGVWNVGSLGFAAVQVLLFIVVFYVFYFGLRHEDAHEIVNYLVYIAALTVFIVFIETMAIYIGSEDIIIDGHINRNALNFGWGTCNNSAQALTVLVPIVLIGVARGKYPALYFLVGTVSWIGAILNISRTAFFVATPVYLVALVVAYIFCKKKKRLNIAIPIIVLLIAGVIIREWDVIKPVIDNYVTRGLDDNGRYYLWEYGINAWREAPIFGKGFFGMEPYLFQLVDFIPKMMHNTPIQILAAMGVFGLAAYGYHRVETAIPIFRRPSFEKTMLGGALASVLLGSLLENFIFYIHPMFYFTVTLAVIFRLAAEEKREPKLVPECESSEKTTAAPTTEPTEIPSAECTDDTTECEIKEECAEAEEVVAEVDVSEQESAS